jgi:N-acetylmuramoyl-L-alanine amidase
MLVVALVASLLTAGGMPPRAAADEPTPTPTPRVTGDEPSVGNRGQTEQDVAAPTPTATPVPTATLVPTPVRGPAAPGSARRPVVVLDPGHGGEEVGAAYNGVVEKHSNLEMAARVQRLLQEQGIQVVLTRYQDSRAAGPGGVGWTAEYLDRQGRIDIANAARGDVLVSIHSNGSVVPQLSGVEAWFDPTTYYGGNSQRLALLLKDQVIAELARIGYDAVDRGLQDSSCHMVVDGVCSSIMVISERTVMFREDVERQGGDPEAAGFKGADSLYTRALAMPSALIELLFITNPSDAAMLSSEVGREAMARGVTFAILQYFAASPAFRSVS